MEPLARQTTRSGWLAPRGEERLDGLDGWRANVMYFFSSPHHLLVLRFGQPDGTQADWSLVCVGSRRIEVVPDWTVDGMRLRRTDDDTLVIEEAANSIRIECDAVRFFNPDGYTRWMGLKDGAWRDFPTENDVREMLRQDAGGWDDPRPFSPEGAP